MTEKEMEEKQEALRKKIASGDLTGVREMVNELNAAHSAQLTQSRAIIDRAKANVAEAMSNLKKVLGK
jgi:hypothetical protein